LKFTEKFLGFKIWRFIPLFRLLSRSSDVRMHADDLRQIYPFDFSSFQITRQWADSMPNELVYGQKSFLQVSAQYGGMG